MSRDAVETHFQRVRALSQWPDDDGPYFEESAYHQVILDAPTREERESLERAIERHVASGGVVEHYEGDTKRVAIGTDVDFPGKERWLDTKRDAGFAVEEPRAGERYDFVVGEVRFDKGALDGRNFRPLSRCDTLEDAQVRARELERFPHRTILCVDHEGRVHEEHDVHPPAPRRHPPRSLAEAIEATLEAGRALAADPRVIPDGKVSLRAHDNFNATPMSDEACARADLVGAIALYGQGWDRNKRDHAKLGIAAAPQSLLQGRWAWQAHKRREARTVEDAAYQRAVGYDAWMLAADALKRGDIERAFDAYPTRSGNDAAHGARCADALDALFPDNAPHPPASETPRGSRARQRGDSPRDGAPATPDMAGTLRAVAAFKTREELEGALEFYADHLLPAVQAVEQAAERESARAADLGAPVEAGAPIAFVEADLDLAYGRAEPRGADAPLDTRHYEVVRVRTNTGDGQGPALETWARTVHERNAQWTAWKLEQNAGAGLVIACDAHGQRLGIAERDRDAPRWRTSLKPAQAPTARTSGMETWATSAQGVTVNLGPAPQSAGRRHVASVLGRER